MKAIIPAAGYGTRMGELTKDKPKALLEVRGKPIIEYIIKKILEIKEVNEIIVVTNSKFFEQIKEWARKFKCSVNVKVIDDGTKSNEERLGSIGDLSFALESSNVNEDFIVINSDNLFSFDLKEIFFNFKEKGKSVIGLYNVRDISIAKQMGSVGFDYNNRIIYFKEKDQNPRSSLCSIGIYFFPSEMRQMIKLFLKEGNSPDRSGDFLEWLYKIEDIYAFDFGKEGNWFDIGSLEGYKKAFEVANW
jgi:glucose-1-phosphate thymidylyltransferase